MPINPKEALDEIECLLIQEYRLFEDAQNALSVLRALVERPTVEEVRGGNHKDTRQCFPKTNI